MTGAREIRLAAAPRSAAADVAPDVSTAITEDADTDGGPRHD